MAQLSEIETEFERAQKARAKGNEGQARVCARRAAGIAARHYLARGGSPPRTSSAYDTLQMIADDSQLSAELRDYAAHLTLRVDEEFRLPPGIDLVAEARRLCTALLGEEAG